MKRGVRGGKYVFEYELGMSSLGNVAVYKDKEAGALRIGKTVAKRARSGQDTLERLRRLQRLDHPHLARIVEVVDEPSTYFIVSEFFTGSDLAHWVSGMDAGVWMEEAACANYVRQALQALAYCEQNRVYHGDLRPTNLLLTSRNPDATVKVNDVGLHAILDPDFQLALQHEGPYMAPEVSEGARVFGTEPDVWSIGAIAKALLTGTPPQTGMWANVSRLLSRPGEGEWSSRSAASRDLVQQLLLPAGERPSAARALQHPWLMAGSPGSPASSRSRGLPLPNEAALVEGEAQKLLCYMLAVLLIPLFIPVGDLEQLYVGFNRCDEDSDGFISPQQAYQLLQGRGAAEEAAAALATADVWSSHRSVDFCTLAVADLLAKEAAAGSGRGFAQRLLRRLYDTCAQRGGGQRLSEGELRGHLQTATRREMEARAGVDYEEILSSVFPAGSSRAAALDQQALAQQLVAAEGAGTPLSGMADDDQAASGVSIFGMDFDVGQTLGSIFQACGLGKGSKRLSPEYA